MVQEAAQRGHVVLLGDSILDNGAYVGQGQDVVTHLRTCLGSDWGATLLAQDGNLTAHLHRQLEKLPHDASHLVVSSGGNDALADSGMLDHPVRSSANFLDALAGISDLFFGDYSRMLNTVLGLRLPTMVCTVYYPHFAELVQQRRAVALLASYNDAILRAAFEAGAPVIDLRQVCTEAGDYANAIEPSAQGGGKIARAIYGVMKEHDFDRRRTTLYGMT